MMALSQALCSVLFEGALTAPYRLSTLLFSSLCSAWSYCLHVMSKECLRTSNAMSSHKGAMLVRPFSFLFVVGWLKRAIRYSFKASIHIFNHVVLSSCISIQFLSTLTPYSDNHFWTSFKYFFKN